MTGESGDAYRVCRWGGGTRAGLCAACAWFESDAVAEGFELTDRPAMV